MQIEPWMIDLGIGALIALLGIKGLFQGFILPFFNLSGVVAGVFFASTYAPQASFYVKRYVFAFENDILAKLVAFALLLVGIWLIFVSVGALLYRFVPVQKSRLSSVAGYLSSMAKYFVVFALIVYVLSRSTLIGNKIEPFLKESVFYPYMFKTARLLLYEPTSKRISSPAQTKDAL